MTSWKGFNSRFGFAKASVWGTPVLVSAGHRAYINSEGLEPDAQFIPSESITGSPFPAPGDKGDELHSGPITVEWDFETIHRFLAFAMGTAGVPNEVESDFAFAHTLRFADSLEGLFATLVFGHSGLFVREYTTATFNGFSMSVEHNQRVSGDFPVVPQGVNYNTSSGTNELTTLEGMTLPADADLAYATFNGLTVLINDADDVALDAGDEVYVSQVGIEADGNLLEDDVTTHYAPLVDEPVRNGEVATGGSIRLSKLENTDFLVPNITKGRKKMKWTFLGDPVVGGSTQRSIEIFFSNVQFKSVSAPIEGKEVVGQQIEFQASKAVSAHTGFSFTDAIYIVVTNGTGGDPLA